MSAERDAQNRVAAAIRDPFLQALIGDHAAWPGEGSAPTWWIGEGHIPRDEAMHRRVQELTEAEATVEELAKGREAVRAEYAVLAQRLASYDRDLEKAVDQVRHLRSDLARRAGITFQERQGDGE